MDNDYDLTVFLFVVICVLALVMLLLIIRVFSLADELNTYNWATQNQLTELQLKTKLLKEQNEELFKQVEKLQIPK